MLEGGTIQLDAAWHSESPRRDDPDDMNSCLRGHGRRHPGDLAHACRLV